MSAMFSNINSRDMKFFFGLFVVAGIMIYLIFIGPCSGKQEAPKETLTDTAKLTDTKKPTDISEINKRISELNEELKQIKKIVLGDSESKFTVARLENDVDSLKRENAFLKWLLGILVLLVSIAIGILITR